MALTPTEVDKIAHLARLHVAPEHRQSLAEELDNILALVEQMSEIDTQGVEPLAHPLEITQRLRPDRVTEHDQRSLFQSIAPSTADGLYLVPRVIDG